MKAYASQRPPSSSSSSTTLTAGATGGQVIKRDDLLASDSGLTYGEHTPDDAALDRVSGHLNAEAVLRSKHSRRRPDDSEAEVNYINDKNKHFNKKVARFYDSYTTEIRENCACLCHGEASGGILTLSWPFQSSVELREWFGGKICV